METKESGDDYGIGGIEGQRECLRGAHGRDLQARDSLNQLLMEKLANLAAVPAGTTFNDEAGSKGGGSSSEDPTGGWGQTSEGVPPALGDDRRLWTGTHIGCAF